VKADDPFFNKTLERVLQSKMDSTYEAAIQAMLLSELDPAKYQLRLAECAQFLVDNQYPSGGWSYSKATTYPAFTPSAPPKGSPVSTKSKTKPPAESARVKPTLYFRVKQQRTGSGNPPDNSNSQYAILGLRACMEANVYPPRETLDLAKKWWTEQLANDGGWNYGNTNAASPSTGSMTTGGIGAYALIKHYLQEPWANDPMMLKALKWLGDHFSVTENPGGKGAAPFYYLYSLERAGVITSRTHFGVHDWYREGAVQLLAVQKADGTWDGKDTHGGAYKVPIIDTCFAILFLRRLTPPLEYVATVDPFTPKK
jgi:hypothetical protein